MVFDSVGKDTFAGSLDSLKRRGLLVCFGTASGPFPPIDALQLAIKGSLYFTRPALADYIADPAERAELAGELFDHVAAGPHQDRDQPALRAGRRRPGASRPRGREDDRLVDLRHLMRRSEKLTTPHRRRTASASASPRPSPNDDLFGAIRRSAARAQGPVPARPGHQRPSTSRSPSGSATLEDHPVAGSDPEHPGLVRIYKDLDSPPDHYENAWHCDATWREKPPMGAVLRCVECPPVGGDTIWANMAGPTTSCPSTSRTTIAGLRARHSIEATFGARMPIEKRHALKEQFPGRRASGRAHPSGDRREGAVRQRFTTHFTNFHTAENVRFGQDYSPGAAQLLNYLIARATIPEYQVRWRWRPNSVAIWDNRCTQHYAVMDYWPAVRKMERAGIIGDKPY